MLDLYQKVSLNRDFLEYNLVKGDIATLINLVPHPEQGKDGYVLEIFNAIGESINVIIIPMSAVETLRDNEILSVRSLSKN